MNYREVFLHNNETLASSGTKIIDINVTDWITEILVKFTHTNDTSVVDNTPPQESLDKIEIVDGGQVYHSLTGVEAVGVACYDTGKYPPHWFTAAASGAQTIIIPMRFGRYLGDPEYGFNPRALLNPQLKVTWSNESGILSTGTSLEVMATVVQGVTAPSRALFTKTIESWTPASGVKENDLPVDYPYRRLYARQYHESAWLGYMWSDFELDCDVGKLKIFEWEDEHWTRYVESRFPEFAVVDFAYVSNGDYKNSRLGNVNHATAQGCASANTQSAIAPNTPHYMQLFIRNQDGTAQSDQKMVFYSHGSCPESMYCYEFGDPQKPETWFDAPSFGSIKFKTTAAEAGTDASVLLQQPRPVP